MKSISLKKGIMIVTVTAVAGAILMGSAGLSQAMQRGGMFGDNNGFAIMRGLDLSDSQKDQIRNIFKDFREKNREEARGFREGLKDLDETPSDTELARMKTNMADMIYKGMKTHYDVLQVLTPEQRSKLEEKMKEGREDRRDRNDNRQKRYNEKLARELDLTASQQKKLQEMKVDREDRDGISFLAEKLDLTFSQNEKIRDILDKYTDKGDHNIREMGMQRFRDLRGLTSSSTFDEAKAKKLASDMAEEMVSRLSERRAMSEEIMEVLDEDQKEEFKDMRQNLWDRGPFGAPSHGGPRRK